ncbi:nucleoside triphosphate hydrolase protein [Wolfiporia cocos MD-104 SS10]|uniref:Nucleoside triphosphate hydrolase protein n=1 Tax=Wolfiporia cocos (strain MD-104) TaxID=742152 RepID=A0A2H3JIU7_WOLCO|nr:nucleoside triphosphate hydrolase protein [Wolfiporia cocos MD-104 SS10]
MPSVERSKGLGAMLRGLFDIATTQIGRRLRDKNVTIAVMGPTGVGKTSFINRASGSDLRVGAGLESMTQDVQRSQPFQLGDYRITLIDTPGFDDTRKTDAEILLQISNHLSMIARERRYLSGVIYMHRITDNRMGGVATRNFRMFMHLCGEQALPNAAIVLNMWNEVNADVGNARRQELLTNEKFFKPAITAGAKAFEHDDTVQSAHRILCHLAQQPPKILLIQQEIVRKHVQIGMTSAGLALLQDLVDKEVKHRDRLQQTQKDIEEAIRQREEGDRVELEEALRELESTYKKLVQQKTSLLPTRSTRSWRPLLLRRLKHRATNVESSPQSLLS